MTTGPTPSSLPSAIPKSTPQNRSQIAKHQENEPIVTCAHRKPKVRLHAENLRHPASIAFLTLVPDLAATLDTALDNIIKYLYTSSQHDPPDTPNASKHKEPHFTPSTPPTRSITLLLRDFSGVAYTTGTELDNDHKEIHLSLPYIQHCTTGPSAKSDPKHELAGVLTHELVHCYQHTAPPASNNNNGRTPHPPGGLIEGIADFVRLKSGLEPPHWKRPRSASERASKWDAGYQHTGYFLAWIEDVRIGRGAVGMVNDRLLRVGYVGEERADCGRVGFWKALFGVRIDELWDEYGLYLDGLGGDGERSRGNWEEEIVNPDDDAK